MSDEPRLTWTRDMVMASIADVRTQGMVPLRLEMSLETFRALTANVPTTPGPARWETRLYGLPVAFLPMQEGVNVVAAWFGPTDLIIDGPTLAERIEREEAMR